MTTDLDLLAALAAMDADTRPAPPFDTAALADAALDQWRALTIRFPWSALIADGEKDVENRTWRTHHRGPLLVHSSAGRSDADRIPVNPKGPQYRVPQHLQARGRILAATTVADCHPYKPGCCGSPWAEPGDGIWHWVLVPVRALAEPIPCKGALGLWRPEPSVLAAALEQLAGAR